MYRKLCWWTLCSLVWAAGGAACSELPDGEADVRGPGTSDSSDGPRSHPQISTGLARSSPLSDLSDAHVWMLCDELLNAVTKVFADDELHERMCTSDAVYAHIEEDDLGNLAIDAIACERAVESCLQLSFDDEPSIEVDELAREACVDELMQNFETCTTTVGALEACLNAMLTANIGGFSELSCSADFDPLDFEASLDPTMLSGCQTLYTHCPSFSLFDGWEERDDDWEAWEDDESEWEPVDWSE